MFKAITPDNIEEIPVSEVYKYVKDSDGLNMPSPKVRENVIRAVFKVLNFDLSSDLAFALLSEPKAQLILATAGGGKTTGAQLKVILEKIIRKSKNGTTKLSGDKVLCLVYNKHNVKPMEDKHKNLVARLKAANIKGLDIDNKINACTMHSFCDQWRREYVAKLGYMGFDILTEGTAKNLVSMIVGKIGQKYGIDVNSVRVENVLALYNYAKESMKDVKELENTDKFRDIGLSLETVEEIFNMYEVMKKNKRKYDFTDMLYSIYNLFRTDAAVLQRVQKFYDYIVADEVQDFTPIMISILQLLVSDGTPLLCIGDEDQSIYNFRGADVYNTLNFEDKFDGGEVYLLSRNRRCKKEILDLAKKVIARNTLRFQKNIIGVKDGGSVSVVPYNSYFGQNVSVVDCIKRLSEEQLYDSVVCYRERESSLMLSEMLEEEGVLFNIISGYEPLKFELYNHIITVLDMLENPLDADNILGIWKVLPIKKSDVFTALDYDPKRHKFGSRYEKKHFSKYDYGNAMNNSGFSDVMKELITISNNIENANMNTYFPQVYKLLCKYFWDFKKRNLGLKEECLKYVEEKVMRIFNVNKPYKDVYESFNKRRDFCSVNNSNHEGIVLSTFHGLKGLEFDNVIMIDLDNDIFPNFPLIHSKGYGEDVELMLKEAETRLFYVAITRAISNLTMYYSSSNPSIYISELYGKNATIADSNKEEDEKLEIKTMDVFEDFDVLSEVDSSSSSNDEFEDFDVFSDIDNDNKLDSIDVIDSPLGSSKTTSLKMKSLLDCF